VKATEVAESNDSLLPGLWRDSLHVTCGLTACTPGSAPGPTLGNECGRNFTLNFNSNTRLLGSYNSESKITAFFVAVEKEH